MTCRSLLSRLISVVLIVAFPASTVLAETSTGAVLNTNGGVMVNNTSVSQSAAVYQGDVVRTHDGHAAISLPGSNLSVSPNTEIIYRGKTLYLGFGAVSVSTNSGMAAEAAQVSIKPTGQTTTRYELSMNDNALRIHVTLGSLVLVASGKTYNIAEGTTETLARTPIEAPQTVGNTGPAPYAPVNHRRLSPLWIWTLAGTAVVATAAGVAVASSGHGTVSPSQP